MLRILKGNLLMIIISDLEDLNIKKLKNIKIFLNIPFIRTRFKSEQKPLEFNFITEHKYQCLQHIFHIRESKENNIYVEL